MILNEEDFPGLYDTTELRRAMAEALRPEPDYLVWEWAEKHRELRGAGAAEPGPWDTNRTPYLREIMESLSPRSPYQQVVFMKGSQVGGSETGNNWLGFCIAHSPGPFLYVLPTVETAKRVSKQRIDPLIEGSKALRERVSEPRSRSGSNTVQIKEFQGGLLILTGANSAVGLRQMSARYMMFDEVDGYPTDVAGEGDPIELAWVRSRTYGARRKALIVSSPTIAGASKIEARFLETDQRYYHVPCPNCQEKYVLKFSQFKWLPGEPHTVKQHCPHCQYGAIEADKTKMLAGGEWRATAVSKDRRVVGYHLSALYSPVGWLSWEDIVRQHEGCITEEAKITFANTVLGETFSQNVRAPDVDVVYNRREEYEPNVLPHGVYFITVGVDIQGDRILCYVWGWGPRAECWLIDHFELNGDTAREEVWRKLDMVLDKKWVNDAGLEIGITRMCVDSGYYTEQVYRWGEPHRHDDRIMIIKGDPRQGVIVGIPAKRDITKSGKMKKYGIKVWPVGTDLAKTWFYKHLVLPFPDRETDPEAPFERGFIHLLKNVGRSLVRQLVSEDLITNRDKHGRAKRRWVVRGTEDNHALDGWVYAYAGACQWGMWQMIDSDWRRMALELGVIADENDERKKAEPEAAAGGWRPANRVLGGLD